ncbi:hypothetical protein [Enterobacter sp. AG326]|uniref:hypothetical protein n=1 Tax=Enterobacter sp. AG326 TaxID=2183902 RepID=UPI001061C57E|nr:hypothetical protein [Enterobacter sp. AG326]
MILPFFIIFCYLLLFIIVFLLVFPSREAATVGCRQPQNLGRYHHKSLLHILFFLSALFGVEIRIGDTTLLVVIKGAINNGWGGASIVLLTFAVDL